MLPSIARVDDRSAFSVRIATLEDIAQLHSLIESSVRGLQREDYTSAQIDGAVGQSLGLDTQLILDKTYYIGFSVEEPTTIVACGGWSFRRTLYGGNNTSGRVADTLNPLTAPARIRGIFVHPDWARQGLGSLILAHAEEAATADGFHHFEMASTLTGVHLYLLRGYRIEDTIKIALPNGESLSLVRMLKSKL